jgi:GTP-binding protein
LNALSRIAIVGRPNVGKSTLLNRMCGRRVSIVEPTAGVTRDRVAVEARLRSEAFGERWVEVVDTGGVGIVDRHDLGPHVEAQVKAAIQTADLVLFVVDAREGATPLDHEVARRLRHYQGPVILVANKVESDDARFEVPAFEALGFTEGPYAISAQNGVGLEPLYERVVDLLPASSDGGRRTEVSLKLAIVGRRNAGKSTLVNGLAGEERVLVSEIPGTTRDAVDVLIERDGRTLCVIDTAGVRRQKSIGDAVEFYGEARSKKALRRADVALLLFDVRQPLSSLEKKLARECADAHLPLILGANKWDLVEGLVPADFEAYLHQELPGVSWAPVSFLSAKTGQGTWETVALAFELFEQAHRRVGTGELNRVVERALESRVPGRRAGGLRVRYATQVESAPPTFVLFVNDKRLADRGFLRFLENRIREELPFPEVPLRILLRDRADAPPAESTSTETK